MDETILIVDDSPFIVEGLATILSRKGYTPVSPLAGTNASKYSGPLIPDLILLDIMMEPMDGWETLEKIRENPVTKEIPVLMFSAKKITPAEAQEHSMNIDDFVSKTGEPPHCWNLSSGYFPAGMMYIWRRSSHRIRDLTRQ